MRRTSLCVFALVVTCYVNVGAQDVAITTLTVSNDTVCLTWDTVTNRFIVESSTSLVNWASSVLCSGSSTGNSSDRISFAAGGAPVAFYRLTFGLEVVHFVDSDLWTTVYGAISDKMSPTNEIYDTEVETIQDLSISWTDIDDLTGLETCIGLTNLELDTCFSVSNLAPLSSLHALRRIELGRNDISDVSPLAALTNLTDLGLGWNSFTDASPLAGLTNLRSLDLAGNALTNVAPLAGMTELTSLFLYRNDITDLAPLATLTNLTLLSLGYNGITNLSFITNLTQMTYLNCADEQLSDITELGFLTNLTYLNIGYNNVANLSPLGTCMSLENLQAYHCNITDCAGLEGLTNLTEINFYNGIVTDLSALITNAASGGLGPGDVVNVRKNPVNPDHVDTLRNVYGVSVYTGN